MTSIPKTNMSYSPDITPYYHHQSSSLHTPSPPQTSLTFRNIAEKVRSAVLSQIIDEVRDRAYSPGFAQEACTIIAERSMIAIRDISTNFKLIVNVCILQKVGSGFHQVSSTYADGMNDGSVVIHFENDSMNIVVTVYGIKLI